MIHESFIMSSDVRIRVLDNWKLPREFQPSYSLTCILMIIVTILSFLVIIPRCRLINDFLHCRCDFGESITNQGRHLTHSICHFGITVCSWGAIQVSLLRRGSTQPAFRVVHSRLRCRKAIRWGILQPFPLCIDERSSILRFTLRQVDKSIDMPREVDFVSFELFRIQVH